MFVFGEEDVEDAVVEAKEEVAAEENPKSIGISLSIMEAAAGLAICSVTEVEDNGDFLSFLLVLVDNILSLDCGVAPVKTFFFLTLK